MVAPQVGGYKFTKVLMDGGNSINILYYKTFHCMRLTDKDLKPSNTVFHGVVHGKSAYPVGTLLQDGPNTTLRSETLRQNCVRCHNRK